jgi:hypothetical protein
VKSYYQALINVDDPNFIRSLWKLKAPLKFKIFLWYLRRGVVLTKGNLAKRNWHGSKTCCFCHKDETIRHLFFECHFACSTSVSHLFGGWLEGFSKELKPLLFRAATTCWSLWLVEMILFLKIKNIFSLCRLSIRWFTGYVPDYSTERWLLKTWSWWSCNSLRMWPRKFSPGLIGDLIYKLIVTRMCRSPFIFMVMCLFVRQRPQVHFKRFVSSW